MAAEILQRVDQQDLCAGLLLAIGEGGGKARDTRAHDDKVIDLTRVGNGGVGGPETAVADRVHHVLRRVGLAAQASACGRIGGLGHGRTGMKATQRRRTDDQRHPVQEIAPSDAPIHPKLLVAVAERHRLLLSLVAATG